MHKLQHALDERPRRRVEPTKHCGGCRLARRASERATGVGILCASLGRISFRCPSGRLLQVRNKVTRAGLTLAGVRGRGPRSVSGPTFRLSGPLRGLARTEEASAGREPRLSSCAALGPSPLARRGLLFFSRLSPRLAAFSRLSCSSPPRCEIARRVF